MADLYNCPELKAGYCKRECPIGKDMPIATNADGIEGIALRLVREFNVEKLEFMRQQIIDISADGQISGEEVLAMEKLIEMIDGMMVALSEFRLMGKKVLKGIGND